MPELDYSPLHETWPVKSGKLSISYDPFVELDVKLPLDFVARGGHNTLAFVQHLAQILVNESGSLRLPDNLDAALDLEAAPEARAYQFVPLDGNFTETRGPEGKTRYKAAPVSTAAESTVSWSSRSSPRQNEFRDVIMMRDGGDLFSDLPGTRCEAAHLVPVSRLDLYKKILDVTYPYDPEHGIAMDKRLHRPYDDYEWSIYYHDGRYYFHAFAACEEDIVSLHGRSFALSDMRHFAPPNVELCAWHYRQAVLKHIRGYAVGMEIGAQ